MTDSNDEKYITFNRAAFFAMLHDVGATRMFKRSEMLALDDAVVIRRQDLFASPCLSTYASMIALVASNINDDERAKDLLGIADYFHRQAELAAAEGYKFPDR